MPEMMEKELKKEVASKDWSEEKKNAYIYGTMRKTGWKPSKGKKKKHSMEAIARAREKA